MSILQIRKNWKPLAILIGMILLFIGTTSVDTAEEERELQDYCQKVETHMKDKSTGWPDFKGIYKEACLGEGEKK